MFSKFGKNKLIHGLFISSRTSLVHIITKNEFMRINK